MHNTHDLPSPASHSSLRNLSQKEQQEWIKTRAYFISENRKKSGRPGDATSDWLQASVEIMAEAELEELALLVFLELKHVAKAPLDGVPFAAVPFPASRHSSPSLLVDDYQ